MKLRCQIGSNSPLAKRKARMLSAASLPRKWSMRKICRSSKTSCRLAFSDRALSQVGAERLLHDDPAVLDQPGVAERVHHRERRLRRHREVVQPGVLLVAAALRLGDRGLEVVRPVGRPEEVLGELLELLLVLGVVAELLDRLAGEVDERLPGVLVERGADDLDVRQQARAPQVQHPGQQLAPAQVTGGTEQDDRRGRPRGALGRLMHRTSSGRRTPCRGTPRCPRSRPRARSR